MTNVNPNDRSTWARGGMNTNGFPGNGGTNGFFYRSPGSNGIPQGASPAIPEGGVPPQ